MSHLEAPRGFPGFRRNGMDWARGAEPKAELGQTTWEDVQLNREDLGVDWDDGLVSYCSYIHSPKGSPGRSPCDSRRSALISCDIIS